MAFLVVIGRKIAQRTSDVAVRNRDRLNPDFKNKALLPHNHTVSPGGSWTGQNRIAPC